MVKEPKEEALRRKEVLKKKVRQEEALRREEVLKKEVRQEEVRKERTDEKFQRIYIIYPKKLYKFINLTIIYCLRMNVM